MKLPETLNNRVSFVGGLLASISLLMIIFFFVLTLLFEQSSNYLGLFTYIILPVFLVIGLILIPIGMISKRKKLKDPTKEMKSAKTWVIDFTDRRHRNAAIIFGAGTIFFLFLSGIGSYEAFHYTESVEFCGKMCHQVMKPEYVAYQKSPHANVSCAECHVGPGADWYVKSKLSGLRQVFAVIKNDYPHPIPTPIRDLRPAQVTCEQCHWPEKFYSHLLVNEKHYLSDYDNTEWNIDLRMKVGASHSAMGNTEGIHWHINQDVTIEYWDQDGSREMLPYVRFINKASGDTTVYIDEDAGINPDDVPLDELRTMDCMDCHNRPSHNYETPPEFVNFRLASGEIPKDLPEIKMVAMTLFSEEYETAEQADSAIEAYVNSYYTDYYPELAKDNADKIEQAVTGLKDGFHQNIFPYMKASWKVYPDHIGHITYNGCFRCHNDRHTSNTGTVISKDCNLCHTILLQGPAGEEEAAPFNGSLEFKHPIDIGDDWKYMNCSDCHAALY